MATGLLANAHGDQSSATAAASVEDWSCLAFADGAAGVANVGDDTVAKHVEPLVASVALSGFAAVGFVAIVVIITTATIVFAVKKANEAVSMADWLSTLAAIVINY